MTTYVIIIFLFGVALVQSQPTSTSDKSKSEFKDLIKEKKFPTTLEDGNINGTKQGNRTKKSVVCLEIPPSDCSPGCSEHVHQEPQIITSPGQSPMIYRPAPQPVPQSTFTIPSAPSIPSVMFPSGSQSGESPSIMMPSSQPQFVLSPGFQPHVIYQPAPQSPNMMSSVPQIQPEFPQFPTPQRPQTFVPQTVGPVPQLPPCPPDEQIIVPESKEVISYEVVPVSKRVPGTRVITKPGSSYPCIPTGQSPPIYQFPQQSHPPQSHPSFSPSLRPGGNQFYGAQGSASSAASASSSASSMSSAYGFQQSSQPSGHVHMVQLPSSNTGNGYPSFNQQTPYMNPPGQHGGNFPNYGQRDFPSTGYQQPVAVNSQIPNCLEVVPGQGGAYGYQSSQSAAQSAASAQSSAYGGYGMSSFRSGADPEESGSITIGVADSTAPLPQIDVHTHSHTQVPAYSARFSSYDSRAMDRPQIMIANSRSSDAVSVQGLPQYNVDAHGYSHEFSSPISRFSSYGSGAIEEPKVMILDGRSAGTGHVAVQNSHEFSSPISRFSSYGPGVIEEPKVMILDGRSAGTGHVAIQNSPQDGLTYMTGHVKRESTKKETEKKT